MLRLCGRRLSASLPYGADDRAQCPAAADTPSGRTAGFEACGPDGVWHKAFAEITGNGVRVEVPGIPDIAGVRYAWRDWPEVDLRGENGLPLAPFVL